MLYIYTLRLFSVAFYAITASQPNHRNQIFHFRAEAARQLLIVWMNFSYGLKSQVVYPESGEQAKPSLPEERIAPQVILSMRQGQ